MHDISKKEMGRRIALAQSTKTLILNTMPIEEETDFGLIMTYRGFYMQVDFAFLHPLMVITLLRKVEKPAAQRLQRRSTI